MKILLIIFCIITGLFAGGCALVLSGIGTPAFLLTLAPVAVFLLNVLLILAVLGWVDLWRPMFYVLAVLDFIIALGGIVMAGLSARTDPAMVGLTALFAAAFVAKGYLTWVFIRGRQTGGA